MNEKRTLRRYEISVLDSIIEIDKYKNIYKELLTIYSWSDYSIID
jgi:hypothetical protein